MNFILIILLIISFLFFSGAAYFTFESFKEKEKKAYKNGILFILISLFLSMISFFTVIQPIIILFYLSGFLFFISLFIPSKTNQHALLGSKGYNNSNITRFDERDSVFVRVRSLKPGSDIYKQYYTMHPEKEKKDMLRREKGFLGCPGNIDNGYQPNVAMVHATDEIPDIMGFHAVNTPDSKTRKSLINPENATDIVKNFTRHLGADMVGICKINPDIIYSHRGEIHHNKDGWGQEIKNLPKYAVVMLTQMSSPHVNSAPHTPSIAESAHLYGKGAYITTVLAKWFSHMGYKGIAEHPGNYDMPLPPLAVDAGLGEVGRLGYLIAPKYGPRVRIFAVLTDMPLLIDKPISIGADEFCIRCKKCAEVCPSQSIPLNKKIIYNGVKKWKLDEESCFNYWSKIGTDCSVCMAICPFSRPDTTLHRIVRWFVTNSYIAQYLFPYIDNFLYGKKWSPKKTLSWLDYRQGNKVKKEIFG